MRKLASIQKIKKIEPIEGADRIELVHVLGWQCVAKKGEFKEGDYCVYFEIDSFLPIEPRFEFLRNSSYKKSELLGEGFRLKTQKMRGQISQGLVLPCSVFPELWYDPVEKMNSVVPTEGQDVTELLGVRKWEIPEKATTGGTVIGQLPYDVPHTDEIRVQNFLEYTKEFAGLEYYITTKMDGSSHSISIDENGFHVTGHNYEYKDDDTCSFYKHVKERGYEELMRYWMRNHLNIKTLTIQGEFCAPGIQKNRLKLEKPEWYVFTVRVNGERMSFDEMIRILVWSNFDGREGFKTVPLEERGWDLPSKYPTVESLLERADGEYPNGGKKEGIVIRPVNPVYSETIGAELSMKVVNNKYLLKND